MTGAAVRSDPVALRSLIRPDGSVLVPAQIAEEVLKVLTHGLIARVRADGGELSPAARRVLFALHDANVRHLDQQATAFASETPTTHSGSVELTTRQVASTLGCSLQYARSLARTGRLEARRAGRDWLINPASLDAYRTGSSP